MHHRVSLSLLRIRIACTVDDTQTKRGIMMACNTPEVQAEKEVGGWFVGKQDGEADRKKAMLAVLQFELQACARE